MSQKAKGSATAPTVPSHGSTNPTKDQEMNMQSNITAAAKVKIGGAVDNGKPYKRPSDSEILEAMKDVDFRIYQLKRAAMVAEEYITFEITAGNCGRFKDNCILNSEQVDGILYMLDHLRELTRDLQIATDGAYGREVSV